jgi:YidC/Oxa1 family membrane protein insertase
MEKRVLIAVVLSFIVLYGFQALFPPPKPRPAPGASPGSPSTAPGASQPPAVAGTATSANPAPTAPAPTAPAPTPPPTAAAQPLVGDAREREIVVENDAVRAVFSTKGGVLTSWRLKKYSSDPGTPLDLVPGKAPEGSVKPFTLSVDDAAITTTLSQALFKPSGDALDTTRAAATLTFEYRDATGLSATKTFAFTPDQPYQVGFSANVSVGGTTQNPLVKWGPAIGTGVVSSGFIYSPSSQPIFYRDRDTQRIGFDKVNENRIVEGNIGFGGVDDHYFLTAVLSSAGPLRLEYEPIAVPVAGTDKSLHFVSWGVRFPEAPSAARFFLGPKDFDVLATADRELVWAIDFGMFRVLVVPLLRTLKWVNGYIGNYGWSIIALTVIINLVMFPLRHKSVVSMRKMQELQPEVKAIQERYAKLKMSDPARQKMNVELMNLYRERGVNPASGCVPMLLTLPVLFAFYSMLSVAIELRGAPFIGWIKDLSVYDPWFVTPILMGATQFVQQKMTPTTGDPAQQRIMLFMPLIFMTMFIWAPSGLVLYWTVSNLWAIGQQVLTNKLIGPAPQRTIRPPAERRLKTAGGGKSDAAKERK